MSANSNSTNNKELPSFSKLKPFEQLAIQLRAEGRTAEETVNQINEEFTLAYKIPTIHQWFMAGGRLEQAYFEYTEAAADQSLKIARNKLKDASKAAANTLIELQEKGYESTVRLGAAKAILNKFIPDKQIVIGKTDNDDLPPELLDAARNIVGGEDEHASTDAPDAPAADKPAGE